MYWIYSWLGSRKIGVIHFGGPDSHRSSDGHQMVIRWLSDGYHPTQHLIFGHRWFLENQPGQGTWGRPPLEIAHLHPGIGQHVVLTWFSHNYQWHLDVHHPINWGSDLIVFIKISHHPITSSFPPGNCWVASWRLLHPLGRKWVCSLIPYGVVTVSCMIISAKAAHCLYVYIYISRSFSKLVSVYNFHLFFLSVFLCSSIYIYLFVNFL